MALTWIYLIKDNTTGFHKIGFSHDPEKRLKTLCRQSTLLPIPNDFTLVEAWLDDMKCEAKLHEMFSDIRVRGEWFNLGETDLAEISFFFYEAKRFSTGESEQEKTEREAAYYRDHIRGMIDAEDGFDCCVEGWGVQFTEGFNYATMYD